MVDLPDNPDPRSWMTRHRGLLLIGAPLLTALVAGFFYLTGGRLVSTDDAFVAVAHTEISSNVAGQVAAVLVQDNQPVKRGDLLFRLDERPFRIAVAAAEADLAAAKLTVEAMKATYQQRLADRQAAQDLLGYRRSELERQQKLAAASISSRAQLDQAAHEVEAARQQWNASQQSLANVLADLGGDALVAVEHHPLVREKQARLDRARLDLGYTAITAPSDGIATKVEQLQPGDTISAATPVFSLMSADDIWLEANFKETDLTYMRVGQSATIAIDAYPGRRFTGIVVSLSPGTGSSFALLPPENATGNWVKVVQRVAVRIGFAPLPRDVALRAGLSALVTVDTLHRRRLWGRAEAAQ